MKQKSYIFLIFIAVIGLSACSSYKSVPYLQQSEKLTENDYAKSAVLYDASIMPKDLLTITVSTITNPEDAYPFNLTVPSPVSVIKNNITTQPAMQTYLVDNEGRVNFPVLGLVKLGGLTKTGAESLLKSKLKEYLKEEPIVTVRLVNYKISVLGEVTRPNTYTVENEKINIFEALALAGDLTVYGKRDNVKIIREMEDGQKRVVVLSLNDKNIIFSPYFYLQQNDIVYVQPNKAKAQGSEIGSMTGILISTTSILVSLAGLMVTILK
ncbi:polysaccharide biosynthesis/export family protein [Bacteroides sedimenti]|uniref:Polysaccharide export outer membrane protein n=1 Tax=Bacteroides sedimenti TaxID=2136147 RepID=A0ABM8IGL7_9BACE